MSLLSNIINNTRKLIDDIRMDDEEKRLKMIAEKRSAKRTMQRSIDSNRKKITDIEQQIAADNALGKKYALEGNRDLAAMQAEKVLFKTPVLQKINKVVLNQEKIFFVLDSTEDINTFNQELVVFDKIDQVNSNPDLLGVQAEKAVDNIMQQLESPMLNNVKAYGEPMVESPMVKNMIDGWLGKGTQEEPIITKQEPESVVAETKKEEQKAKIKELEARGKYLSREG